MQPPLHISCHVTLIISFDSSFPCVFFLLSVSKGCRGRVTSVFDCLLLCSYDYVMPNDLFSMLRKRILFVSTKEVFFQWGGGGGVTSHPIHPPPGSSPVVIDSVRSSLRIPPVLYSIINYFSLTSEHFPGNAVLEFRQSVPASP